MTQKSKRPGNGCNRSGPKFKPNQLGQRMNSRDATIGECYCAIANGYHGAASDEVART